MLTKIICLLNILLFTPSLSAVLGIDFGAERIKVAAVIPGRSFDIILDGASKRSHPSLVVFDEDVRQYGTSASSLVSRRPLNSFLQFSRLLGKPYDTQIIQELEANFLFNEIVKDDTRNTVRFVSPYYDPNVAVASSTSSSDEDNAISEEESDDNTDSDNDEENDSESDSDSVNSDILNIIASEPSLSVEEIVTMKLKHVKAMAEKETESDIKDCVITVPEFYSYKERQALLDSAQMAGLNILGLINENTAAALQYALNREYAANKTENIIIYNMGATSTKVSVVRYFAYSTKITSKKNKTTGSFEILSQAWDETMGANNFDRVISGIIIERAFKSLALKKNIEADFEDVEFQNSLRKNARFTARVRIAAKRAKKILSANLETFISIEGVYKDEDFSTTLTREDFYSRCRDLFDRAAAVLNNAVNDSLLAKEQLDSIVVIGGGTRIPKIRIFLTNYLGKPFKEDLNADEAPAFGAAFRAANLSSTFKVRAVGMDDITTMAMGVRLTDLHPNEGDEAKTFKKRGSLFNTNNKLHRRRAVTLKHATDLKVQLFYETTAPLPMDTSRDLGYYEITGVPQAIEKYSAESYNITELPKISLSFLLNANSMVELVSATATFTEYITEEKLVKKTKATDSEDDDDDEKDSDDDDKKDVSEKNETDGSEDATTESDSSENGDANASDDDSENETEKEMELVTRKRNHRVELRMKRFTPLDVRSYSNADFAQSAKILLELDERDRAVRETANARNSLESYIFESRNRLYEEKNVEKVTTDEQRSEFLTQLTDAEDWIWDVEVETAGVYKSKLRELKKTGKPIFLRADEITARPTAIDNAGKTLGRLYESIEMLRVNYTWVNATEIDKLENMTKKAETWLNAKIEEQDEQSLLEKPVFLSYEVYYKAEPIVEFAKKLLSRPKPYNFGKKKKSKNASNGTNSTNTTSDSDISGDEDDLTAKIEVDVDGEETDENIEEDTDDYDGEGSGDDTENDKEDLR